jgi:hypothetical protein
MQFTYNVTMRRVRITIVAVEKHSVLNIVCVCTTALVIRHAKRLRHVLVSPVACLALPHFTHYLINGMTFGNKIC